MDRLSVSTVGQGKNQKCLQSEVSMGFGLKFKIQRRNLQYRDRYKVISIITLL